jgi:AbiV family abortive infection protein
MARPDPRIPRDFLRQGILTCLSVASSRLAETDALMLQGLLTQSGVLFTFALEEFGKAVLLKRAYDSGNDPALIEGFYDHQAKLEAAAAMIPADHLRIDQTGYGEAEYGRDRYGGAVLGDFSARLAGLYVDWKGRWVYGRSVDPEVLSQSSREVQSIVSRLCAEWT